MPVEFLQIEPQLNFNTTNRHFEDLPENFLETISPQQSGGGAGQSSSLSINLGSGHHVVNSSQLASLTGMGVSSNDNGGGGGNGGGGSGGNGGGGNGNGGGG